MRMWTIVLVLGVAGLAPAAARGQEASVDSLALARQYTTWLYAGQGDSLAAHATSEAAESMGGVAGLSQVADVLAEHAGTELEVYEETWKRRNGACQYWRVAGFSGVDEPVVLRWVLDREGRITGLGIGPESQTPPVESETCAPADSTPADSTR